MGPDAMIARRWIEKSGGWAAATGKMPVGLVAPPRWRLPMRVRFGTGCGTRTRGVVSVIKSDVQSPLCQASVEMVPPTRAAQV